MEFILQWAATKIANNSGRGEKAAKREGAFKKRADKVKRKIKKKKISFMKNYAFYLQI